MNLNRVGVVCTCLAFLLMAGCPLFKGKLSLIDTNTDSASALSFGSERTITASNHWGLTVDFSALAGAKSVRFEVPEANYQRVENSAPYSACGDDSQGILPCSFLSQAARYTLIVMAFSGPDATGDMLEIVRATLVVEQGSQSDGPTIYISPFGNDSNNGQSASQAVQRFNRAFELLQAGTTLMVADGVYHDSLYVSKSGLPGQPIVIRGESDGGAIIDGDPDPLIHGDSSRVPFEMSGKSWVDVENLVFVDSVKSVFLIDNSHHINLRRVSGYNVKCSNCNYHVLDIAHSHDVLVEDCSLAGRGRTIATIISSNAMTVRRCWMRGDEGTGAFPTSNHLFQYYNTRNSLFENNIAADPIPSPGSYAPTANVHDWTNAWPSPENENNRYLASVISNLSGHGILVNAVSEAEKQDANPPVSDERVSGHVFQDLVIINDKSRAIGVYARTGTDMVFDHLTVVGRASFNLTPANSGIQMDFGAAYAYTPEYLVSNSVVEGFSYGMLRDEAPAVTDRNNNVEGNTQNYSGLSPSATSTNVNLNWMYDVYGRGAFLMGATNAPMGSDGRRRGARILYKSIDGEVSTTQPLWPWPMENRIWNETKRFTSYQQSPTYEDKVIDGETRRGGYWKTIDGVY